MWQPCVGVDGICPPLCKWSELNDGTYTLADVALFNNVIKEKVKHYQQAVNNG
jgi:hypothetical protein